ncbi:hypothetical protein ABPG75_012817 [Micractinium tetrahymenae]
MSGLGRGTGAMLAASTETLAAPRQPGEGPAQQHAAQLQRWAQEHVQTVAWVLNQSETGDWFYFRGAPASRALAEHALNAGTGLEWVAAVAAALEAGPDGIPFASIQSLADLLVAPHAVQLRRAVLDDAQVQERLLAVLLPGLLQLPPLQQAAQLALRTFTCVHALLTLAPAALSSHLASPAGLRSLQAACKWMQQLGAADEVQRRRERRAASSADQQGRKGEEQAPGRPNGQPERTVIDWMARVRLTAGLAASAMPLHADSARAAVVCRLLAEALPALVWAVRQGADAAPAMGSPPSASALARQPHPGPSQDAWSTATLACQALGQALQAAASCAPEVEPRCRDASTDP